MSQSQSISWDLAMESFFNKIIPDVSGDIPFVCLDVIECLDHYSYTDLTVEKVAKVIGRPKMIVEKTVQHLVDISVILSEKETGIIKLDTKDKILSNFLLFYKAPTGRLVIIEKILGF